jgi:hypothetical protein
MKYLIPAVLFLVSFFLLVSSCAGKVDSQPDNKVPDSEMYHIVFSLDWLLANDAEPGPSTIKITFPESWLKDSPEPGADDSPVYLDIPRKLLNDNNSSKDPDFVTVVFPNRYFEGIPEQQDQVPVYTPQLFSESSLFHFFTTPGENPPDEIIRLYSRFGAVNWTLSADAPWLTLSRTQGTARSVAEQRKTEVAISIDATGLKKGTYTTALILTAEQISYRREIPINLYVTDAQPGQSLDIDIMLAPDSELAEGSELTDEISLERVQVRYEILSSPESRDWPRTYAFNTGDFCLIVTGKVKNNTKQDILVNLRATGYDKDGNEVSWSLQVDPSHSGMGITTVDLAKDSSADFTLYMGWSEDIELISVFVSSRDETDIPPP